MKFATVDLVRKTHCKIVYEALHSNCLWSFDQIWDFLWKGILPSDLTCKWNFTLFFNGKNSYCADVSQFPYFVSNLLWISVCDSQNIRDGKYQRKDQIWDVCEKVYFHQIWPANEILHFFQKMSKIHIALMIPSFQISWAICFE